MSNVNTGYINNKKLLNFEELLSQIDKCKSLFNKETIEYLYSLLNLEVSSLNTAYIDEDKAFILSELKMFKKLVQYNLYYKTLNLIDCSSEKYKFISNDLDLSVYILRSLLYELCVKDGIANLILYKGDRIISPEEQMTIIEKQIEDYLLQLQKLSLNNNSEYMSTTHNKIYLIEKKIESLKLITTNQLLENYKHDKYISEQRNSLLTTLFKENNISIGDFELENSIKGVSRVKKYGYANVYVK